MHYIYILVQGKSIYLQYSFQTTVKLPNNEKTESASIKSIPLKFNFFGCNTDN